jgi:hypothetical protein
MSEGLSFESFCAKADCHVETLYEWAKVNPAFSEAKKTAFEKNRLFWDNMAVKGCLMGKDFNATMAIFNLKNRFPKEWRDRKEIEVDNPNERLIAESVHTLIESAVKFASQGRTSQKIIELSKDDPNGSD